MSRFTPIITSVAACALASFNVYLQSAHPQEYSGMKMWISFAVTASVAATAMLMSRAYRSSGKIN